MKTILKLILLSLILLSPASGFCGETTSPPKGVSLFYFRYGTLDTDKKFNSSGNEELLGTKAQFDAKEISQFAPEANRLFNRLKKINPQLANSLNFGQIELRPQSSINYKVIAFAQGITDRFMLTGYVPFYEATVRLKGGYDSSRYKKMLSDLRATRSNSDTEDATNNIATQLLEQAPNLSGEILQGTIVNELGYKPLGHWTGSGWGDFNLFGQYRYFDSTHLHSALRIGTSAPTGRTDDPDNLVDIQFGTGHWIPYIETVHDLGVYSERIVFSWLGRLEQGLAAQRTLRYYDDAKFPLSAEKDRVKYKLGASIKLTSMVEYSLTRHWKILAEHVYFSHAQDEVTQSKAGHDYSSLEKESDSEFQTLKFGTKFSTIEMYKSSEFPAPVKFGVYIAEVIAGKNSPQYTSYLFDFELYF